jgi:hypothetical protein
MKMGKGPKAMPTAKPAKMAPMRGGKGVGAPAAMPPKARPGMPFKKGGAIKGCG